MPDRQGYAVCAGCRKERQTTGTGRIVRHRKWNGVSMVDCPGSLMAPLRRRQ